ncbi:MAG: hypothetical protein COB66_06855, partial [Coxiella sp. (in: Bacteria)]
FSDFNFYYNACDAFKFGTQAAPFFIKHMRDEKHCPLVVAAEPLHWFTQQLRSRVHTATDHVCAIDAAHPGWRLQLQSGQSITTQKIIMAIGSTPRVLDIPYLQTIPLTIALDPEELEEHIELDDRLAVFGGSQSADAVLRNLGSMGTENTVHFYRSQSTFDFHLGDSALDSQPFSPDTLEHRLAGCNKAIYAIGFQQRSLPIESLTKNYAYDTKTGVIAPGIYGIGIAFPELLPYRHGQTDYPNIAIPAFCERLDNLLDDWLNTPSVVAQSNHSLVADS